MEKKKNFRVEPLDFWHYSVRLTLRRRAVVMCCTFGIHSSFMLSSGKLENSS